MILMRSGFQDIRAFVICCLIFFISSPVYSQESGSIDRIYEQAGLEQHLGKTIPADLEFSDEAGHPITLNSLLHREKPIILTLAYHDCPMLCSVLLDAFTKAVKEVELNLGEEYEIVTLSINPDEALDLVNRKKQHYLEVLDRAETDRYWHFLTGSEPSIRALADAIGYRYAWIEEIQQYVHPAVITVLTPEGEVSRYLQGLRFNPRDIRLALVEASEGKVGTPIDFAALFCLQYDPETNTYTAHAANLMKIGGGLTVIVLGIMLFMFWRKEKSSMPTAT